MDQTFSQLRCRLRAGCILYNWFAMALLLMAAPHLDLHGQQPAPPPSGPSASLPDAPDPRQPPAVSSDTTIQVTATPEQVAEAQVHLEEKQRIFGVFPNFYVSYIPNPVPLKPRQKFHLAFRTLIDPVNLGLVGVTAGVEQADNVYAWGQSPSAFGKRYAAAYGTFMDGTLLGSAVLPVVLHQDPRYFVKGTGSIPSRAFYAIANSLVCKGDNHRWQPNISAIAGGLAASAISNLYYPPQDRDGTRTLFVDTAVGTAFTAFSNLFDEFASRKLTPHTPPANLTSQSAP